MDLLTVALNSSERSSASSASEASTWASLNCIKAFIFSLGKAYGLGLLDERQIGMIAEIQNNGYYVEVDE